MASPSQLPVPVKTQRRATYASATAPAFVIKERFNIKPATSTIPFVTSSDNKEDYIPGSGKASVRLRSEEGFLKQLPDDGAEFLRSGHFGPGEMPNAAYIQTPEQILDPVSLERQQSQDIEELRQQLNQRLRIEDLNVEISLLSRDDEEERNHCKELEEEAEELRRQVKEWEQQQLGHILERNNKARISMFAQLVTKEILDAWSSQYRESMNAFQARLRLLSATSVQKEASIDVQISPELRSRYTQLEEENSNPRKRLEQMAAGEDYVTIQVEHGATELNVSTTNLATKSTEGHAGSILRNAREVNISKSNINAAREIYNVTISGDTHLLQGKIFELSDEVKKMNDEREQFQRQIATLQEAAEDRSRRKVEFHPISG
ncbi:hypothetical protein FA15DRAFT_711022 [Coprinopsis marcescibilis]|uniref:Uncharacterized protein n=1 Tax=Coprinopsis marcescibilis TaxID=230819 RepID=A0A5C3KAV0_COPMA|nr:hypothetical protein FA15DRAFT_711022 [Coprinopsis marcescibilis]